MLATGSTSSPHLLLVSIYRTRSSVSAYSTGWVYPCLLMRPNARIYHLPADCFGDHQVGCGGNSDRIHHHNVVRDVLFSAAQSAALVPRQEAPALIPGSQSRPADVFLSIWSQGRPAALDITVISPLQQATVQSAASSQCYALLVGEA